MRRRRQQVSNAAAATDRRCVRRTALAEIAACPRAFFGFWRVIGLIVAGSRACRSYLHAAFEVKRPAGMRRMPFAEA